MSKLIPFHDGWNGNLSWSKSHSSGLFVMKVSVHRERQDKDGPDFHSPPRIWNSYLLGGDRGRWYWNDKAENWIEKDWLTDLVFEHRDDFFDSLRWNGGQTFFEAKADSGGRFPGLRSWCVGDDYAHYWDGENGRWFSYDFDTVQRNIQRVADEFHEKIAALQPKKAEAT